MSDTKVGPIRKEEADTGPVVGGDKEMRCGETDWAEKAANGPAQLEFILVQSMTF